MQSGFTEFTPFSRLFLAVLLHFVWQATLIFLLVAIIRGMLGPKRLQARYLLPVVGLLAILAAPLATGAYYLFSPEAMATLNPPGSGIATNVASVEPPRLAGQLDAQFQNLFHWFDNHRSFWLGCWAVGFVVLLGRLCLALGYCFRLRRSQQPLPPHLAQLAETIKRRLNITHNVVVAASREIAQAIATGIIRPMVLIPAAWVSALPPTAIEAVLAHELAHIRRWDLWVNLLQRFAETVFFFHPLVWWLSRIISYEREFCCDQLAIEVTGNPVRYVETLARVTGVVAVGDFEFQFGNAFFGGKKMNLLRRAKIILEPGTVNSQSPFRTLTLIACVGLLVCYGSYAYCKMPIPAIACVQDHEVGHDRGRQIEVTVVKDDDEKPAHETEILHRHLIELLHGSAAGKFDRQKLAQDLRQLADQIDLQNEDRQGHEEQGHSKPQRSGARELNVQVIGPDGEGIYQKVEPEAAKGYRIIRSRANDDGNMMIEITPEVDGTIKLMPKIVTRSLKVDDDQQHTILRANDAEAGQKIKLRRLHDAIENSLSAHGGENDGSPEVELKAVRVGDPVPGEDKASRDEIGQLLRDLKTEVQQLRNELDELRSSR
jgi:beta-lactamase regulating signal transducer with metallopeptidase domain